MLREDGQDAGRQRMMMQGLEGWVGNRWAGCSVWASHCSSSCSGGPAALQGRSRLPGRAAGRSVMWATRRRTPPHQDSINNTARWSRRLAWQDVKDGHAVVHPQVVVRRMQLGRHPGRVVRRMIMDHAAWAPLRRQLQLEHMHGRELRGWAPHVPCMAISAQRLARTRPPTRTPPPPTGCQATACHTNSLLHVLWARSKSRRT